MKRSYLIIGILLLLAISVLALSLVSQAVAQDQQKPTVVPADVLTPAETPSDKRDVAVLTFSIVSSEDGKLERLDLQKAQIIRSYAPNVLDRPGEWTIEVLGDEKIVYGVQDPRQMNVYGLPNETTQVPHQTEFLREITWETVVPLYLFDRDINATEIHIYDRDGQLIFSTKVDRDNWTRQ